MGSEYGWSVEYIWSLKLSQLIRLQKAINNRYKRMCGDKTNDPFNKHFSYEDLARM
jgi:hypothetical protein